MRKFITTSILALSTMTVPVIALAQVSPASVTTGLLGALGGISVLLNGLIGVAITLAIVVFFWGLIKYLFVGGAEGKAEGLKIMFYGVVTIFVMISVWGLVELLQYTFGVRGIGSPSTSGLRVMPTF